MCSSFVGAVPPSQVCAYIHTYIHIHIQIYVSVYVYTYVYIYVYVHVYTYIYIYEGNCMFVDACAACLCQCQKDPMSSWYES